MEIRYTQSAEKQLRNLEKELAKRIYQKISSLKTDPYIPNLLYFAKVLVGYYLSLII